MFPKDEWKAERVSRNERPLAATIEAADAPAGAKPLPSAKKLFYTNLFLKHLFDIWQKDFASAEASRGLCGRPLHSFAPHPYNRLE